MKDFLISLFSICLLIISILLFYKAKSKRSQIEFTYEESSKSWIISQISYWTILKKFAREKNIIFIIISILITGLVILCAYIFFGKSVLGITFAVIIAIWGTILSSVFLGTTGSRIDVDPDAKELFKILEKTVKTIEETFTESKIENFVYSGYVELPKTFYVDEAEKIVIYLELILRKAS